MATSERRGHHSSRTSRRRDRSFSRSRSRSVSRSRSRGRSRSRSRERRSSRSWSRERRSRSRERRSRSRERRRHRRSWREHDDRDEVDYSSRRDDRSVQLHHSSEPGPVVMLRNLVMSITKEQLVVAMGSSMSSVRDIRLIQNREGSRNYAFAEFNSADDATKWMNEHKEAGFRVRGCEVNITYSRQQKDTSIDSKNKRDTRRGDWNCFKCGTLNFSKRSVCLTCDCTRSESDSLEDDRLSGRLPDSEQREDASEPPSNVIIIRGLELSSNEKSIRDAISGISNIHLKDIRLIKDKVTNISRGFCFVETNTSEECGELMKAVQEQFPAFFIDGKRVNPSFARQNIVPVQSKPSNAKAAAAIEQAQAMNQQRALRQKQQQHSSSTVNNNNAISTSTGTSAEVPTDTNNCGLPSTYMYDSASGFYYDTTTGLYYDPKTQYHYNSQTGQYCYYDSNKLAYISVNSDGTPVNNESDDSTVSKEKKRKDVTNVTSSKSAKKIAKDMERWAKSINTQKQVQQSLVQQQQQVMMASTAVEEINPLTIMESSTNEPTIHEPVSSSEYIDIDQLACLLCKRKFSNESQLLKHQQFSDLHKQNMEKESQRLFSSQTGTPEYRDRAKERRDKFGTVAIVPGWKKRFELERARETIDSSETYESPETQSHVNVGSKLLKAMGWNEGEGLGKQHQGITRPIEAEQRAPAAGLGSVGSHYGTASGSGSYRENVKSVARARFQQMFQNKN